MRFHLSSLMETRLCQEFLARGDSLLVCEGNKIIFASNEDGLLPLLEYIDRFSTGHRQVKIFDKVMGNAAALLSVLANCQEVYSPLGSQLAIATLDKYQIRHHVIKIVPHILNPSGVDMCPMERVSINKVPEEFYNEVTDIIRYRMSANSS